MQDGPEIKTLSPQGLEHTNKKKKTVYVSHALNSLFCFIFGHGMIS